MSKVDKAQILEDYASGLTLRALSVKYGIPKSTIADWAKKAGRVPETKKKYVPIREKIRTACPEVVDGSDKPSTKELLADLMMVQKASPDYELIRAYTVKLLKKADDLLDLDDALAPRDLKSLSSMLLDVRTLLNTLSPLEEEEQRLRLLNLRKQAEQEDSTTDAVVIEFVNMEGADA